MKIAFALTLFAVILKMGPVLADTYQQLYELHMIDLAGFFSLFTMTEITQVV
jgi:hypothetical protein